MVDKDSREVSEVTSQAVDFVAAHREPAVQLGRELDSRLRLTRSVKVDGLETFASVAGPCQRGAKG